MCLYFESNKSMSFAIHSWFILVMKSLENFQNLKLKSLDLVLSRSPRNLYYSHPVMVWFCLLKIDLFFICKTLVSQCSSVATICACVTFYRLVFDYTLILLFSKGRVNDKGRSACIGSGKFMENCIYFRPAIRTWHMIPDNKQDYIGVIFMINILSIDNVRVVQVPITISKLNALNSVHFQIH